MADRYEYSEKATSPVFRAAFVKLFDKPDTGDSTGRQTWQITAILASPDDVKVFQRLAAEAGNKLWGDKWDARRGSKQFKSPFRTGADMENRDGERFTGFENDAAIVVKLTTSQGAPGVVDKFARRISGFDGRTKVSAKGEDELWEVIEENEIYSGMWCRATFVAQAYERSDGFGVSLKLENIQKVRDDEKLGGGGRAKAEDDFQPVEDLPEGDNWM